MDVPPHRHGYFRLSKATEICQTSGHNPLARKVTGINLLIGDTEGACNGKGTYQRHEVGFQT